MPTGLVAQRRLVRPFDPALKILDEVSNVSVIRRNSREPLGVFECSGKFSGIAVEGYECQQDVAILRMPGQAILEHSDRLLAAAGGMERDRINIRIARAIRLEVGRPAQLGHRFLGALEAGEREAERVMEPRILR